jgi:hypothetical protein
MMKQRTAAFGGGQQQAWEDVDNKSGLGQGSAREATTATAAL